MSSPYPQTDYRPRFSLATRTNVAAELERTGHAGAVLRWWRYARCGSADPRLFDPPDDHEPPAALRGRLQVAFGTCRSCPVMAQCLSEALAFGDEGVRGGRLLVRPVPTGAVSEVRLVHKGYQPCGTYAAWRRHRRHGEPSDVACDTARAAYVAAQRARQRGAVAA